MIRTAEPFLRKFLKHSDTTAGGARKLNRDYDAALLSQYS